MGNYRRICSRRAWNTAALLSSSSPINTTKQALGILPQRFSNQANSEPVKMDLIKELRERTCASMKDVKAALVDCNWDVDAAQKDLRKRGKVLAQKKASRTATEGLLAIAQSDDKAAVIELNCETDFVARNDIFTHLASAMAEAVLASENARVSGVHPVGSACLKDMFLHLEHPKMNGAATVENAITEVAAMMGENIKFRRGLILSRTSPGIISTYLHKSPQPGLGRIAGILSLELENGSSHMDLLNRVGSEVAMHIVAANPLFLMKELVSTNALETEREILKSQAESSGKSDMVIDKMVEGRLRKYYEDVVLMEQKFVMNDSIDIKTLLCNLSDEIRSSVKIGSFLRMEVGEGIKRRKIKRAMEKGARFDFRSAAKKAGAKPKLADADG